MAVNRHPASRAPITANATYCATLVDQWCTDGLEAAFIAPGSRSTPLALALFAHQGIRVEILHDERAAAFAALGRGLATGVPAVVLCSSGTAGAHFYAAVIEADASAVPLIAVTADRPPELWGRGAPQTIDQTNLYGTRVRHFAEPGPPEDLDQSAWRIVARTVWQHAIGRQAGEFGDGVAAAPGPVHLNQSFRDPLTGTPGELPAPLAASAPAPLPISPGAHGSAAVLRESLRSDRGVFVVGRSETDPAHVLRLAERLRWPVIADHRSGCRSTEHDLALRHFDSLLRDPSFAAAHQPDVVVRIGEIVSSKATSQWLSAAAAGRAVIASSRPHGRLIDPEAIGTLFFDEAGVIAELVAGLAADETSADDAADGASDVGWLRSWTTADRAAARAIDEVLAAERPADHRHRVDEITVARQTVSAVPAGGALVVASSMPVRDVEWFAANRSDIAVYANRGANGIDGIVATAVGVATTGCPTVCLIGDVAFLHDSTTLVGLRSRAVDLTIVVTDNDGGGIFSFLPQHQLLGSETYEPLFGTPHGTDLRELVAAHGLEAADYAGPIAAPNGVRVVIAKTDRAANLALHDRVHAAVAAAVAVGHD